MNICTIIARNYLAHARVLAESFSRHHPAGTCWVLVIDGADGYVDAAAEPFELVDIGRIGLPDLDRMAAVYDVTELSTAVKPWLLRHLLDREGVETVTYLDPDIWVADSIAHVWEAAAEHGIALTPHLTSPLPRDGLRPSEEDIMSAGAYNLGFISLSAGETANQLLDWWSERLDRHCTVDPANGLFVDQRWIDLVPGIWPRTAILRDPGCNLAYWNLPTRRLEIDGDRYLVDGEPLRFLHFSGFDPRHPDQLSKHQDRIEVNEHGALSLTCREYAERLYAAGFEQVCDLPYGWETLPNGVRIDGFTRGLFEEAEQCGVLRSPVFGRRGAERFTEFMREAPSGGVSRYARAVYDSRDDLQRAFPDVEGRDAAAFEYWLGESAASLEIAPALVTHRPRYIPETERNGRPVDEAGRPGINLCGYLDSELGVGEAARQVRAALEVGEVAIAPVEVPVEEARMPGAFAELRDDDHPYDVNLVCVNADMLPAVARTAPPALFENRRSAGIWFWEVERFPERWRDSFDHLDEVWTASEFVADSLRPLAPIPVRTIRIPVTPTAPAECSRRRLSMPDGFCFLFVFDFRSVFRRKNPLAVVEAFRRAFEPGEGASLLIKSVAGDIHSEAAAELAAAAAGHPDVHLFDEVVPAAEKNAMIAGCDCYVSLHRSEGLGLTMAEAMYFGRPVIATAYSGNLDFMDEENSYLVDYSLEPIGRDAGPYPPRARWAEPSVEHAAELMRQVFEDPEAAARVGERAARSIRESHSPQAAGELLTERLAELRGPGAELIPSAAAAAERASGEAPLPAPTSASITAREGRARLQHLLSVESPPPRGRGRLKAYLKRAYLRLLRPYTAYQRQVDLSLRDSIDEIGAEVAAAERRMAAAGEANLEALREEVESLRRELGLVSGNGNGHPESARVRNG